MKTKSAVTMIIATPFGDGRRARFLSLLVLIFMTDAQISAVQSVGNGQDVAVRTLEVLDLGYKLPIELVAVRNLQSKRWMRDLELEIRNVSGKPIYELYVGLYLPDDKDNATDSFYGANLQYGRINLMDPSHRPSSNDKPIGTGETVVLKVEEQLWRGYEHHVQSQSVPEEASYRVRLVIAAINFGDGTGFTRGGIPYPRDPRTKARYKRYVRIPVDPE